MLNCAEGCPNQVILLDPMLKCAKVQHRYPGHKLTLSPMSSHRYHVHVQVCGKAMTLAFILLSCPQDIVGEGRESWYAFYFLGHQQKTISQTDLPNSANENSKSWALLMIVTMAVQSMISRVWGCKKRSSSVSTLPPGRESWYAWWGELIRPIYTTVAV